MVTLMLHLSAYNHIFSVMRMVSMNTAISNRIGDNPISQLLLYSEVAEMAVIATTRGMLISQLPVVKCAQSQQFYIPTGYPSIAEKVWCA